MDLKEGTYLESTLSKKEYPITRIKEWSGNKEPLEVKLKNIHEADIKKGKYIWERFIEFLPFENINPEYSLGEGNTPILKGSKNLKKSTSCVGEYIKYQRVLYGEQKA